jgi:hypothetical protein
MPLAMAPAVAPGSDSEDTFNICTVSTAYFALSVNWVCRITFTLISPG